MTYTTFVEKWLSFPCYSEIYQKIRVVIYLQILHITRRITNEKNN